METNDFLKTVSICMFLRICNGTYLFRCSTPVITYALLCLSLLDLFSSKRSEVLCRSPDQRPVPSDTLLMSVLQGTRNTLHHSLKLTESVKLKTLLSFLSP